MCSPLNYWHKTTSPCTFTVFFLFVLGTRANRRLFKTELFSNLRWTIPFFFYVRSRMCSCKEDVYVCVSAHVFLFVLFFVLTVRCTCSRVWDCLGEKMFKCINNWLKTCRVNCVYRRKATESAWKSKGKKKALRLRVCACMQGGKKTVFPGCLVSFNVQNVYMNDAKEKFADKALIWRLI